MAERTARGEEQRASEDEATQGEPTGPRSETPAAGGSNATRDRAVEPASDAGEGVDSPQGDDDAAEGLDPT